MSLVEKFLSTKFPNGSIEWQAFKGMVNGRRRKIARVTSTWGRDMRVQAFPQTGPVEVFIGEAHVPGHMHKLVPNGWYTSRVIEPGEPVVIGKRECVKVISVVPYEVPTGSTEPQLVHPKAEFQTI